MQNKTTLAIEQLKRDTRFAIKLDDQQTKYLVGQCEPFQQIVEQLQGEVATIRSNKRLSFTAIAEDISKAKRSALEKVIKHQESISRNAIIADIKGRIAGKVKAERDSNAVKQTNADWLAMELRTSVLPRLVQDGERVNIPAEQVMAKLALQAAEQYPTNPAKMETIIRALDLGWPFALPLNSVVAEKVNSIISRLVAAEEATMLDQAEGIEAALAKVAEAAAQEVKELG